MAMDCRAAPHGTNRRNRTQTPGAFASAMVICVAAGVGGAQQPPGPPPSNPLPGITTALRAQQFRAALERSAEALRQFPHDPRLWTLEGMSYAGLHKSPEAMASFRKALGIAPDYLPALEAAAQLSYATQSPGSEDLLHRLVHLQPEDQVAHAMLGELAFKKGDCRTATEHFVEATEAIAQRAEVLMQYSSCLVDLSRFEEAAVVFRRLLALRPNDGSVQYDLALAELRAGKGAEAAATLAPVLALTEPSEDDLTLGAEIAESQGKTQNALDLLRRAILLYPREQSAYLDFANLAFDHASIPVGLDVVNVGLKQMPQAAKLYFARGVLLCQLGRVDEGFVDFNRANELDPTLSFVGVAEGIAHSQSHHTAAALTQFRSEVKQHPNDALAWYLLAEALSEQGQLKGTPGFKEAVEAAKRASELDPKRVDAKDLLASMYLQAEDAPAAIRTSRAALAVDPNDPQALYHLVLAVRKTDQKAELPDLVKRLMEARHQAEAKTEQSRPRTLVEVNPNRAAEQE